MIVILNTLDTETFAEIAEKLLDGHNSFPVVDPPITGTKQPLSEVALSGYNYISDEEFTQMIFDNKFFSHIMAGNTQYGYTIDSLVQADSENTIVLVPAASARDESSSFNNLRLPDAVEVFVYIAGRTCTKAAQWASFNYFIIADTVDDAVMQFKRILAPLLEQQKE